MKAEEPKLLRVSKAAHEVGLHPLTVRKWIKAGKIHAIRVGNEARVPRSEIERLAGKTEGRLLVLYGRVSGQGQKAIWRRSWHACPPGQRRSEQSNQR